MSDTPRTDALINGIITDPDPKVREHLYDALCVFARTLERELNAALQQRDTRHERRSGRQ